MRYPTLRRAFCRFELRTFLAPNDQQSNSADEREPAKNRRDRNSFLCFCRDMHWPHIQNMVATGVIKALIRESQRTQHYQYNSSDGDWFHIFDLQVRKLSFGPE